MRASVPAGGCGNPAKRLPRGKAPCAARNARLGTRMPVDIRLYALVDPARAGGYSLPDLARLVADGGATLVQLRDKNSGTRAMVDEARAIKAALAPFRVPLVINDRVDVALAAQADGVHVGQDDMAVAD